MTKKITISSFKTKSSRNTEVRKVPNLQSPSISNIVLDLNLSQNFSFKDTLLDDENLLNANINDTKNIKKQFSKGAKLDNKFNEVDNPIYDLDSGVDNLLLNIDVSVDNKEKKIQKLSKKISKRDFTRKY